MCVVLSNLITHMGEGRDGETKSLYYANHDVYGKQDKQ